MLFYIFLALYIVAAASPLILAIRGRRLAVCFVVGWMSLLIVERSFAYISFFYPRAFGFQPTSVQSPDAPDMLPALLVSLFVGFVTTLIGYLIVAFRQPARGTGRK